ncbi:MAG: capsule assembly Wzi family protein [Gemmatimonadota bacterium]
MRRSAFARFATLALVAVVSAPFRVQLAAQSGAIVPPTDFAYVTIERLAELGVLDSVIIGQRPYSRGEIARIARVGLAVMESGRRRARGLTDADAQLVGGLLRQLQARFGETSESTPADERPSARLDGIGLTLTSTDAERRAFPGTQTGLTETTIDPLATRRLGAPAPTGQTLAFEAAAVAAPASWITLQARGRVEARQTRDAALSRTNGEILLASLRARYRNAAVTIGRNALAWSQGEGDGLFLASDAPALDQLSLTGDHPFALPWILRVLGPTQATVIAANLGASRVRSGSLLTGYKVSIKPDADVELGGTFLNHWGGAGARSSPFIERVIDNLPIIDVFRSHNYDDSTKTLDVESDKSLGIDGRWRMSSLGGVLLTGEMLIDDFDHRRLGKLLTGYGSQTLGIVLPKLGSPALSMKVSVKHLGIVTYTHVELSNGMTSRGRLLGDELGPDAKSFGAQLRWTPSAALRVALDGRTITYSKAEYESYYSDAARTLYHVRKKSFGGDERRDIAGASMLFHGDEAFVVSARVGAERIRNADFGGLTRHDYVAELALRIGM